LEKEPDDRYQSIAELAQALAPHAPSVALSSVSRISGILRSSLQPKDPTSTTLRSATGPPRGDPASEKTEEVEAVPGASEDKRTHTDFGGSKSDAARPRWKTWAVIGAAVFGVFAMAGVLLRPRAVDRAPASEPAHMTESVTAMNPTPSANTPSVPLTEQAAPQMLTAHPASLADGGPRVRPVESAKAKATKLNAAPVKAPPETPPARHPGAKEPAAHPMSDDPLEGRR